MAAAVDTQVAVSGESQVPDVAKGESVSSSPAPALTPVVSPTPAPSGTPLPGTASALAVPEDPAPSPASPSALAEAGSSFDKKCIFCKIGSKEQPADLLHRDEEFACFRDIHPGAPHHYLVVPRKHVGNCKSLKKEHISIVEAMVTIGKNVLLQNGIDDLSDVRLGFHWPPFCSVAHLHLHVLAPASQMGFISRIIYRANSYWFITVEQLIEKLKTLPGDSNGS